MFVNFLHKATIILHYFTLSMKTQIKFEIYCQWKSRPIQCCARTILSPFNLIIPTPRHLHYFNLSVTTYALIWNFVTFTFYLLAKFLQNFMVRETINSKLWYFCRDYPIKFCYILVVSKLRKITWHYLSYILLASINIDYKKVFELLLAGDNTKNTVDTKKIQKIQYFFKNADVNERFWRQYNYF